MKIVCIYHSRDLDGWMSAAIVKLKYSDCEFIGWDYGQPILDLTDYDKIIMIDISFPRHIMEDINSFSQLIWIDHHISAIKEMEDFANLIEGKQNTNKAACELSWEYFFPNKNMPEIIRLLGRYDCFGHKGTDEELKVIEFQYGARQQISNMDEAYSILLICRGNGSWDMSQDVCDDIHLQGQAIYKYVCSEAKSIYNRKFQIWLDGNYLHV